LQWNGEPNPRKLRGEYLQRCQHGLDERSIAPTVLVVPNNYCRQRPFHGGNTGSDPAETPTFTSP
jgi:hypothetical protein